MKPVARPVYLDLLRIHLPLTGWVSILHRVSGVLLFLTVPAGVWALSVSLGSEVGFRHMVAWASHPVTKMFLLFLVWAFAHHVLAGLRHLALDVHWGVSLQRARQSSVAVMLVAALITLLGAWRLFA